MTEIILLCVAVLAGALIGARLARPKQRTAVSKIADAEQIGPGRWKVTYPCGETEIVEAEHPGQLIRAIAAHTHPGGDA